MKYLRRAKDRGHANHGWLDTYYTFSFADYYDPNHMGFRCLRVINDDTIAPGAGFPTHGHRDMEIVTCVLEGALEHKDTIGNSTVILPNEVQRMSAGTGIRHSEFNHLKDGQTHLYQIWIETDRIGHTPSYEQKSFLGKLNDVGPTLVLSQTGENDSVTIHQDIKMYICQFKKSMPITLDIGPNRHVWVQVISGDIEINGETLETSDGVGISQEPRLQMKTHNTQAKALVIDLP